MLYPFLGVAFFPRTDAGQFVMNIKAPSGSRLEVTTGEVQKIESLVRRIVDPRDLDIIVSNIGVQPGFSSLYTSNAGPHTATVQVALHENHRVGSYEYMSRMRQAMRQELPHLTAYFQSGGMVDAVLNQGLPAPIDVQLNGSNIDAVYASAAASPQPSAGCPASATSTSRRTSTTRRCGSTSIASAPPRWASTSARSSTTSSRRSPPTR